MSDDVIVRDLEPRDYEWALEVINEDCISGEGSQVAPGGQDYYRERGSALVAEHEGAAVGYLLAFGTQKWNIVKVNHIVISHKHRRKDIALRLYERLMSDARVRGVFVIVCWFTSEQPAVLALHKKLGFEIELQGNRVVARMQLRPRMKTAQR
jgi:predicted GNAT superfamily acetyltransferase